MLDREPRTDPVSLLLFSVALAATLFVACKLALVDPLAEQGKRLERIEAQQVQILKQQGELKQAQHYLFKSAVRTEIYLANQR